MKVAIAGKGGSGKTTIAGTLARVLAEGGRRVLAIDADLNPNLGPTLGLPRALFDEGVPLPHEILRHEKVDGRETVVLARPLSEIVEEFGIEVPGGIRLLTMGRPGAAGGG